MFPNWTYEAGKQLIDILTRVRSIFSEKKFFEVTDSFNPEAGQLFKDNPNAFLEESIEAAKKAKEEFMHLPEDCPYRFSKVEKIPDDVKMILENNSVGSTDRKEREEETVEGIAGQKGQGTQA